jgi:hypothetical protein
MGGVKIEIDFEVGGGDAKAFVGFAVDGGGAGGFGGDDAGHEFLRDENAESLRAALGPVVETGEHGVLVVEIVVEDGDEGRFERKTLFKEARLLAVGIFDLVRRAGACSFHLDGDVGDAVGEKNVRTVLFFGLRGPFVADRCAVGLQDKSARDLAGGSLGGFKIGIAFGEPAAAGGRDFELFMADGLAIELDGELAVVLGEDRRSGRGGILFLVCDTGDSERKNQSHAQGESETGPSPGNFPCHGIPLRSVLRNATHNLWRKNLRGLF